MDVLAGDQLYVGDTRRRMIARLRIYRRRCPKRHSGCGVRVGMDILPPLSLIRLHEPEAASAGVLYEYRREECAPSG
jgi:hypothetical protein